jgi:hypothetical protein
MNSAQQVTSEKMETSEQAKVLGNISIVENDNSASTDRSFLSNR